MKGMGGLGFIFGQVEKQELLTEKVQLLARVREQAKEHLLESRDHARILSTTAQCQEVSMPVVAQCCLRKTEGRRRSQVTWKPKMCLHSRSIVSSA